MLFSSTEFQLMVYLYFHGNINDIVSSIGRVFFKKNDHDLKNDVKTCIVNVGIEIIHCSTLPQSSYING